MARAAAGSVIRQLETLFEVGSISGLTDRQLLERYASDGRSPAGEAAFAALVARHGPMVLGVCRQLLVDQHHAEDAFQAVFLVLSQKARSIRDPDLLGNWLYGVALRTARCAKQQIARRRRREERDTMSGPGAGLCEPAEPVGPPADQPAIAREQAEAIHGAIERLPRAFRSAVVLCYFEGLTLDEAARRLRCPAGTLHSRLARAREKLRSGLASRGLALPAVLAPSPASVSVPAILCDSTTRAAIAFAARHAAGGAVSARAAALAREVVRVMLLSKIKLTALSLLVLMSVTTGAGWVASSLAMKEKPMQSPAAPTAKIAPHASDPPQPEAKPDGAAPSRMTVTGRVLDPQGQPLNGAVVDVLARPRSPWVAASDETERHIQLGRGQSDGDGRFRLDAPRTASTRVFEVIALAAAPGFGLGWAELNPDAEQPAADLKLQPEQAVRVRLVELTGAPARGVEVRVLWLSRPNDTGAAASAGVGDNPPDGLRAWPRPKKSDDQGRIEFLGIGRGVNVALGLRDMRYARQDLYIDVAKAAPGKETVFALEPARIIEGRVLAGDTGQPIPNAVVSASTRIHNEHANGYFTAKFRADGDGRFSINPIAGESYTIAVFPTGGEPYLIRTDEVKWNKGQVKTTQDIKLPRGVTIRGKVTAQDTGRPLPESSIQFIPMRGADTMISGWQAMVASLDDGAFRIAVPAGKGHLLVFGPTSDYVLSEIGSNQLYRAAPGGIRYYAHAIIPYEVKAGDPPLEVSAELRPGVTIKGRVEGPDGQTINNAFVLTTLRIESFNPHWRGDYQIAVRDGRFELHGLAPDAETRIYVLDPEHEWGASVELSGKQAGEEVPVHLQPCGRAQARFVGPDGMPIAKHHPRFEFVATLGPSRYSRTKQHQAELAADAEFIANVDRKHYWNGPITSADGRVTLPDLIPGATYRIIDFSTINDPDKGVRVRKDFSVKPGKTLDLGDILIEKPSAQ